jgi:hypothetical protein
VANTLKLHREGAVGFIDWLDLLFEKPTECQTNQHAQCDSAGRPFAVEESGSRVSAEMRRIKNERKTECAPNKEVRSEGEICCTEPTWRSSEISLEPKPQQQYDGQNGRGGV